MSIRFLIFLFPVFLFSGGNALSQPADEQLAGQYFNNGEFEKAAMYYEKLYAKNNNEYYYRFLFQCFIAMKSYDDAEKLIKKHSKNKPTPEIYTVDYGIIYISQDDTLKASKKFNEAIESLSPTDARIKGLADNFISNGQPGYALKTYNKGEELLRRRNIYAMEKASILAGYQKIEEMIQLCLDAINDNSGFLISVQARFAASIDFERENDPKALYLKNELLRRVQKTPGTIVYSELLVWYFIQKKDFNEALTQAKALDKRRKYMGSDVYNLALMCRNSRYYEVAIQAFEYVIQTYPDGPYYFQSRSDLLSTLYEKITSTTYTQNDVLRLEQLYEEALSTTQLGKSASTIKLMRELAHIRGYYLGKANEAISMLNEMLKVPGVNKKIQAELKLDLADLTVLSGDIWEASLLYMQVEKDFKEDILGHEAKFRNARVFYYSGSFDYAKAQLDVLKASTSKLIANDALHLSLLIMDNTAMDTNLRPLQLYANAELLIFQNKFIDAHKTLDSIVTDYPGHSLTDEVLFKRYTIAQKQRNFDEAVNFLKLIVQNHPGDILADDAVFHLGEIYQYQFKNEKEAAACYKRIIFEYQGSLHVVEARKRFREITEKLPETALPELDLKQFEPWPESPDPEWLFERNVDRKKYNELRIKHLQANP